MNNQYIRLDSFRITFLQKTIIYSDGKTTRMDKQQQQLEEREVLWGKFLGNKASGLRACPNFCEATRSKGEECSATGYKSQKAEPGCARTVGKWWRNLEGEGHKRESLKICIWILPIFLAGVQTWQEVGNIQELKGWKKWTVSAAAHDWSRGWGVWYGQV